MVDMPNEKGNFDKIDSEVEEWKMDLESLLQEASNQSDAETIEKLQYLLTTVNWYKISEGDAQNMTVEYKASNWATAKMIADRNS